MALISAASILQDAVKSHYTIGQFNLNNLEWVKASLSAAQKNKTPIILGISEVALDYMGGPAAVYGLVSGMVDYMNITVPVVLHQDHASYATCLQCLNAGFTSVMFDGSHEPFEENIAKTSELAAICREKGASLEAELGSPAGQEDNIYGSGEYADPDQCHQIAETGITMLAASIGNIHGKYPADWSGLNFNLLSAIKDAVGNLPLVLHGGTGIPESMIKKSIDLGIAKINVNTECQIAFSDALHRYYDSGKDQTSKGYALTKIMLPGLQAIEEKIAEKMQFFGSCGKA